MCYCSSPKGLRARTDAVFGGEKINASEKPVVLHVALRAPKGQLINASKTRSGLARGRPGPESLTATSTPSASALHQLARSLGDLTHRFDGVPDQVEDHLLQLNPIPPNASSPKRYALTSRHGLVS